jgi:hypothetical protein
MPSSKDFVNQFNDLAPAKMMRRQRFLNRMEQKLRHKQSLKRDKQFWHPHHSKS